MNKMRALHLDYQRVFRPVPWLGVGLLVAAAMLVVGLAQRYRLLAAEIEVLEQQADRIARQTSRGAPAPRQLTPQTLRTERLEVTRANQVLRELAMPWSALFNAVDSSGGPGIALLSLEPDSQKGTVKISGEAKDLEALLAYVKQLASRDVFAGVLLQSHQVQRDVPEKPLRFSLLARWQGAAP